MLWLRMAGAVATATCVMMCPGSADIPLSLPAGHVIGATSHTVAIAPGPQPTCPVLEGTGPQFRGHDPFTNPAAGFLEDVHVVAVGDVGSDCGRDRPVARLVSDLRPDGLLLIGDNVHGDGGSTEFSAHFDPSWSRFRDIWMPVVGNHEHRVTDAAAYRAYFGCPAGPLHRCWRVGAWVIIGLDGHRPRDEEQLSWLLSVMASTRGVPKIVTWHRPRYSSGHMGDLKGTSGLWNAIKDDPDVHLVLWGHDHDYERMAVPVEGRAPLDAMVVGTGGGAQEPAPPLIDRPWREFFIDCTTGVLDLRLAPTSFTWSFVAVPGVILDSGVREF